MVFVALFAPRKLDRGSEFQANIHLPAKFEARRVPSQAQVHLQARPPVFSSTLFHPSTLSKPQPEEQQTFERANSCYLTQFVNADPRFDPFLDSAPSSQNAHLIYTIANTLTNWTVHHCRFTSTFPQPSSSTELASSTSLPPSVLLRRLASFT